VHTQTAHGASPPYSVHGKALRRRVSQWLPVATGANAAGGRGISAVAMAKTDGPPPGRLIDVHAHLADGAFHGRLRDVLVEAAASGVAGVIGVAESADDCGRLAAAAEEFHADTTVPASCGAAAASPTSVMGACLGLHPVQTQADGAWESASLAELPPVFEHLHAHHAAPWLVGVGEVGLDFCPRTLACRGPSGEEECKAEQRRVLRAQARVARAMGLPLNVHSRSAGHHAIDLLAQEGAGLESSAPAPGTHGDGAVAAACGSWVERFACEPSGSGAGGGGRGAGAVLHAFDGKARFVRLGVERGFHFSVPPSAGRSPVMLKWIGACPLDRLLLETDSPALPEHKGDSNVPARAGAGLALIAAAHGVSVEAAAAATTANALRLFPRLKPLILRAGAP